MKLTANGRHSAAYRYAGSEDANSHEEWEQTFTLIDADVVIFATKFKRSSFFVLDFDSRLAGQGLLVQQRCRRGHGLDLPALTRPRTSSSNMQEVGFTIEFMTCFLSRPSPEAVLPALVPVTSTGSAATFITIYLVVLASHWLGPLAAR
jgi:hypothetical protein